MERLIWTLVLCSLVSLTVSDECSELVEVYSKDRAMFYEMLNSTTLENSRCPVRLEPTYLWAQNMTHIHLKFRFSISLDAPACSELYNFTKQVTHNSLTLSGLCIDSGQLILFRLSVQSWRSINYNFCQWKNQEQSTKVLECLKSPYPYFWKYLHANEEYKSPNMHIWWDIYRRYRGDIGDMIGLLELEKYEEGEEYRTSFTKKEKVTKYEPQPNFYCYQNSPYELASWL